ncbi:type II secretion system protein GspL [Desulfogranum marinum]|uniref:type II secretion system protein GspL n=1 Tax=Desulfogranum marinum TaxID=453220 RepID=UPI0029C91DE6|nr:type II secretion system protein GspL [Desulfogranum marinum]
MNKKFLGLYYGDECLTGVVTGQQGKTVVVESSASIPLSTEGIAATPVEELLEKLDWQGGECVCGLSLAAVSTRNLELPFSDKKNITQTLPFELEDQFIRPMEEVVTDFNVLRTTDQSSSLLVFAVEKRVLSDVLERLKQHDAEPGVVVPAAVAVAEFVGHRFPEGWYLVLEADDAEATLLLLHNGICQFCRKLPVLSQTMSGGAEIDVFGAQLGALQQTVGRTLGFLRSIGFPVDDIEHTLVTGRFVESEEVRAALKAQLGMDVEPVDLLALSGINVPTGLEHMPPGEFATALSLSLYRPGKNTDFNLRQGELASKKTLFTSKKQIVAVAASVLVCIGSIVGYYALENRSLTIKNNRLRQQMEQLYRNQFTSATRIQDPYVQMKVALKEMESSETNMPVYADQQRMLDFLADISARIPATLSLHVSRMVIDQKAIRMRGMTGTFNTVNQIKSLLSQSPLYGDVQIVSATADKKTRKIRFEIQLELGES